MKINVNLNMLFSLCNLVTPLALVIYLSSAIFVGSSKLTSGNVGNPTTR